MSDQSRLENQPRGPRPWYESVMPGAYAILNGLAVGVVSISPRASAAILEGRMGRNRPRCTSTVVRLANDMAAGKFFLNGEAVVFGDDGTLLNGQHRLSACVRSGVTIVTLVVVGVPVERFRTFDQHHKRTAGQVFKMSGLAAGGTLAGAAMVLSGFFTSGVIGRSSYKLTVAESETVLTEHPDLLRLSAQIGASHTLSKKLGSASLCLSLFYLCWRASPDLAGEFWSKIDENELAGERWSAARALVKRLDSNVISSAKLPSVHLAALAVKAWNAWVNREVRNVLAWSPGNNEQFPRLAGWRYDKEGLPVSPDGLEDLP